MLWFWLSLVLSAVDWVFAYRLSSKARLYTKPAPWAAMLAWTLTAENARTLPVMLLAVGILLMLVGDVLSIRQVSGIKPALPAYILAMASYFIVLNNELPPVNFSTLMLAVFVSIVMFRIIRRTAAGFAQNNRKDMQFASLVYLLTTGGFLLAGLLPLAKNNWAPGPALAAASGAVLIAIANILMVWLLAIPLRPNLGLIKKLPLHVGHFLLIFAILAHFS